MLNEEIKKFEELTGHSANDYSMEFLGGFWFGYDTANKLGKAEAKPEEADALQYSKGYNDGFLEAKKLFIDKPQGEVVEIAKEKTETRACLNCKHNDKKFYNAPCNVCGDNLNCWEEDSQAPQQNETK